MNLVLGNSIKNRQVIVLNLAKLPTIRIMKYYPQITRFFTSIMTVFFNLLALWRHQKIVLPAIHSARRDAPRE